MGKYKKTKPLNNNNINQPRCFPEEVCDNRDSGISCNSIAYQVWGKLEGKEINIHLWVATALPLSPKNETRMLQVVAATGLIFFTINLAKRKYIGNRVVGREQENQLPSTFRYISNSTILSPKGKQSGYKTMR